MIHPLTTAAFHAYLRENPQASFNEETWNEVVKAVLRELSISSREVISTITGPEKVLRPTREADITCYGVMSELFALLKESKPSDRSEKDRHYAIVITEFSKIYAYYVMFIAQGMGDEKTI